MATRTRARRAATMERYLRQHTNPRMRQRRHLLPLRTNTTRLRIAMPGASRGRPPSHRHPHNKPRRRSPLLLPTRPVHRITTAAPHLRNNTLGNNILGNNPLASSTLASSTLPRNTLPPSTGAFRRLLREALRQDMDIAQLRTGNTVRVWPQAP